MKRMVCFIFFILSSYLLFSDEIELSLEKAIDIAIKNNYDKKILDFSLKNSNLAIYTLWNKFLPDSSFNYSIGKSYRIVNNKETESSSIGYGLDFGLRLQATTFINIYETIRNNGLIRDSINRQIEKLKVDITKSYYRLLLDKKKIEIKEKSLRNDEKIYKNNLSSYQKGDISIVDLLKSEYNYQLSVTDYQNLLSNYNLALYKFKNQLSLDENVDINLVSDFKNPDIEVIKKNIQLVYNSLTLKDIYKDIDTLKLKNINYYSKFIPSLSFGYSFSASYRYDPSKNSQFIFDGNYYDYSNSFRFSISIPLSSYYPFSQDQVTILQTMNEIEQKKILIEKEKQKIKEDYKTLELEISSYSKNIINIDKNIEILNKTLIIIERDYKNGFRSIDEVNQINLQIEDNNYKKLEIYLNIINKLLDFCYQNQINIKDIL